MSAKTSNAPQTHEADHKRPTVKPAATKSVTLTLPTPLESLQRAMADPRLARSADMLALQRSAGNRAVSRLIQTKLAVGPAGDRYEQEADRVAQQVMSMPAPAQKQSTVQRQGEEEEIQMKPLAATITPLVQRQEDEEELQTKPIAQRAPEEEEEVQMKSLVQRQEDEEELQMKPLVQRQEDEEELQLKPLMQRQEDEEEIQTQPIVQRASEDEKEVPVQMKRQVQRLGEGGFEVDGAFEQRLATSRGGGTPLPAPVRKFMEPRFGADFSNVRVHTGGESAQLNRSVSAQAFTVGKDIYLGAGKDDVTSSAGKELLAHELTHVVQQTGLMQRQTIPVLATQGARVIQRTWEHTVEHAVTIRDNIRLYPDRLAHIIEEHALSGGAGRGKVSRFNTDNVAFIESYVRNTIKFGTVKLGPRGAYDFECNFAGPIGTTNDGKSSSRVRVVVVQATAKNDNVGKVQTGYPI